MNIIPRNENTAITKAIYAITAKISIIFPNKKNVTATTIENNNIFNKFSKLKNSMLFPLFFFV